MVNSTQSNTTTSTTTSTPTSGNQTPHPATQVIVEIFSSQFDEERKPSNILNKLKIEQFSEKTAQLQLDFKELKSAKRDISAIEKFENELLNLICKDPDPENAQILNNLYSQLTDFKDDPKISLYEKPSQVPESCVVFNTCERSEGSIQSQLKVFEQKIALISDNPHPQKIKLLLEEISNFILNHPELPSETSSILDSWLNFLTSFSIDDKPREESERKETKCVDGCATVTEDPYVKIYNYSKNEINELKKCFKDNYKIQESIFLTQKHLEFIQGILSRIEDKQEKYTDQQEIDRLRQFQQQMIDLVPECTNFLTELIEYKDRDFIKGYKNFIHLAKEVLSQIQEKSSLFQATEICEMIRKHILVEEKHKLAGEVFSNERNKVFEEIKSLETQFKNLISKLSAEKK